MRQKKKRGIKVLCSVHNMPMVPFAEVDPELKLGIDAWYCQKCQDQMNETLDILEEVKTMHTLEVTSETEVRSAPEEGSDGEQQVHPS